MSVSCTPTFNLKLLDIALREGGTREIRGKEHNPQVLKYFEAAGASWIKDDETAWCSAFMCWVMQQAGAGNPQTVRARKWMTLKDEFVLERMQSKEGLLPGDVVVFERGRTGSGQGHVGLFLHRMEAHKALMVLGGNQNNTVRAKMYHEESFLLGLRMRELS